MEDSPFEQPDQRLTRTKGRPYDAERPLQTRTALRGPDEDASEAGASARALGTCTFRILLSCRSLQKRKQEVQSTVLKRCLLSFGLVFLYFFYFPLLRVMGPACAMQLTRATSRLVWLFSFAGADKRVRKAMQQIVPTIRPDLSVHRVHHGYLEVKQEQFVLQTLYPTPRGQRYVERLCQRVDGKEHLDEAVRNGRGVILVNFHFGVFRVMHSALQSIGYDTYIHFVRSERYADRSFGWLARAIMNKKIVMDQSTGRKVIYHQPGVTFQRIAELLRSNAIVQITGDGMATSRSVDLPFLSGTMSFPTGLARLAAETGAAIVCMLPVRDSMKRHRCILHPPIYCHDLSQASVEAAVRSYVGIFEQYVRQYPWMWWSWRRINVARTADGAVRYVLRDTPTQETKYYAGAEEAQPAGMT